MVAVSSIQGLVASSDVVVVGEILDVQHDVTAGYGYVLIEADRVLKGDQLREPVELYYEAVVASGEARLRGQRALVFAARAPGAESLHLLPLVSASKPTVGQYLLTWKATEQTELVTGIPLDTPIQKVIAELASIQVHSDVPVTASYLVQLALERAAPAATQEAFRAMRRSGTESGLVHGTTGLVALGELEGLEALDEAFTSGRQEFRRDLGILQSVYSDQNSRGVEILARWLRHESGDIQVGAAATLANIHTAEAIRVLGPALGHSNPEVPRRAVTGLSMFADNVPFHGSEPAASPGNWPFRTTSTLRNAAYTTEVVNANPQLLAFWQKWWHQNVGAVRALRSDAPQSVGRTRGAPGSSGTTSRLNHTPRSISN